MKVLVTGAFGSVGMSTCRALIEAGHSVRAFDINTGKNRKKARKFGKSLEVRYGSILNIGDVRSAAEGVEGVIHLAALIPPFAEKYPRLAEYVNVDGTNNLIYACMRQNPSPKLIFTSSIAVYGDRLADPLIRLTEAVNPNPEDIYAQQKISCEELIRKSSLDWVIFRCTYIVDIHHLKLDPLMFEMPLNTALEICDTRDIGLALSRAVTLKSLNHTILPLAGGRLCRVAYKDYLAKMFSFFGLGEKILPEKAFSSGCFHCGYMETGEVQKLLDYQRHTLLDVYREVKKKYSFQRWFYRFFRKFAVKALLLKSPYYFQYLQERFGKTLSKGIIALRFLFSIRRYQ